MYEVNAESTLALYGDFLQATGAEVLLALSAHPLSEGAFDALAKSAAALGFGARACAQAVCAVPFEEEDFQGDFHLGADDLRTIVEGLDPLALVLTDAEAAALFGQAYRMEVPLDTPSRCMGRTVVAFRAFEELLGDSASKQRAWHRLKALKDARL